MRKILLGFSVLCALGTIYLWYDGFRLFPFDPNGGPVQIITESQDSSVSMADVQKIALINLNFNIFDNPIYQKLQYHSYPMLKLEDIPRGRANPFQK